MNPSRRIALSGFLAFVGVGVVLALFFLTAPVKQPVQVSNVDAESAIGMTATQDRPVAGVASALLMEGAQRPGIVSDETPIEEALLEHGEDPGAVYYMSRIREIAKGNPAFARELFRQMQAAHPSSPLLKEAEALLAEAR